MTAETAALAVEELLRTAEALRAAGQLEQALAALLGNEGRDPRIWMLRGEIEYALGRRYDAALSFSAAVSADPGSVDGNYNLGLALMKTKRWDGCAVAFAEVLKLDENHLDALTGLGVCLLEQGAADQSLIAFDQAWVLGGGGRALFGRAVSLQQLGRWPEAKSAYDGLLDQQPAHAEALCNLLVLTAAMGDYDALEKYARRLLEVDPVSAAARQGLATAAMGRQDYQALARYCDQIMEVAPQCAEAQHNFLTATSLLLHGARKRLESGSPRSE